MGNGHRSLPPIVGRADLVRAGLDLDGANRARGSWFGFDYRAQVAARDTAIPDEFSKGSRLFEAKSLEELAPFDTVEAPIFCKRLTSREDPSAERTKPPQTLANVVWGNRPKDPPRHYPLATNKRVQHLIEEVVNAVQVRGKPDIPKVIGQISKGQPLVAVPRRRARFRAERLQLVVDRSTRLTPIWADQSLMVDQIGALFPQLDLMIWVMEEATGQLHALLPDMPRQPAPGLGPLLVLGDLGLLGQPGITAWWRDLARSFVFDGGAAHAILPLNDDAAARGLIGPWQTQAWEEDGGATGSTSHVDRLLTLAAPVIRLEPGLLRGLRRHAVPEGNAADEIAVWRHPALASRSVEAASFDPSARAAYTRRLVGLAGYQPDTVRRALAMIRNWRHGGADEIWFEEVLGLPAALRDDPRFVDPADLEAADAFFANMHGAAAQDSLSSGQEAWLSRIGHRHKQSRDGIWQHPHAAAALMSVLKGDPSFVPPVIVETQPNAQDWYANVTRDPNGVYWMSRGAVTGQPMGTLKMRGPQVEVIDPETDHREAVLEVPENDEQLRIGEVAAPFILQSSRSRMEIANMDRGALTWADEVAVDSVGPRADLMVGDARLRFRWIPPGRGIVGPAHNEPVENTLQRRDEIVFSTGFWLMERPLSIGDLVAILGPGYLDRFVDDRDFLDDVALHPATALSVVDVEQAFDAIRASSWDARLRLPTPREWEYACRAGVGDGTTYNGTPEPQDVLDHTLSDIAWFSPSQAMIDASDRTLFTPPEPMASLSKRPNAWGLYDMLGNVAEWCEPDTSDPDAAIVKGASFAHEAEDIRSAFAQSVPITQRSDWIGARAAIGKAEIESLRVLPRPSSKFIKRNRAPRVQISYDVEHYGAATHVELPFVIGVMADLSGFKDPDDIVPVEDRRFQLVDAETFESFFKSIAPRIEGSVFPDIPALPGALFSEAQGARLRFDLTLQSMDDFTPDGIAALHPELSEHLQIRQTLAAFALYFDGKSAFTQMVETVMGDVELVRQLADAANSYMRLRRAGMETPRDPQFERNYKELEHIGDLKLPVTSQTEALYLGTLAWAKTRDKNPRHEGLSALDLIDDLVASYDVYLSGCVSAILQSEPFHRVEDAWAGLQYLVNNTETDQTLKIRVLDISKFELNVVLSQFEGEEWNHSPLYKMIYEYEYAMFGGEPFSVLVGDYEFSPSAFDVATLSSMARIAAASLTPFIAAASPAHLSLEEWEELDSDASFPKADDAPEAWNALRDSEAANFLALTLPRVLARGPYGSTAVPAETFDFYDVGSPSDHNFAWMNAAYPMAANIARSFKETGWLARIRGLESGGVVPDLPMFTFETEDGSINVKAPVSTTINDRQEGELAWLGLTSLIHFKNTNKAAFQRAHTLRRPPPDGPDRQFAEFMQTRLPYLLPALRFAQYLKVIARDKIGILQDRSDLEDWLQTWISKFVMHNPTEASEIEKAKRPLAAAEVKIVQDQDTPGYYILRLFIRPHYQNEGSDAGVRLTTTLPSMQPGGDM